MTAACPLQWPSGWKRTPAHSRQGAKFTSYRQRLSIAEACYRLGRELDLLHAWPLDARTISSNVQVRRDGTPRSDGREPDDPGVAVYFKLHDKERVLACDKWDRVADNIAAIAAHIDAIPRRDWPLRDHRDRPLGQQRQPAATRWCDNVRQHS